MQPPCELQVGTGLDEFHVVHGHINVSQVRGPDQWPGAGRWMAQLRTQYRQGALPQPIVDAVETIDTQWYPGLGIRQS